MPLHTTILDDFLVVGGIPDTNPCTFNSRGAVEFVLINALALHLLARGHFPSIFILIQYCVCSGGAIVTLIICISQVVLVSGNTVIIYIVLHGNLS